ncbi:LysR family transcriptional regulator [Novosphingobium flavum]|uniref:LysR family transcriptional regulator n=1 Tax=Novosphingobium aerophilum TaxID=2839843 RepID=UPI001639F5A6|nr:LysR family transcriptional regulator [Novosphingobium aerophilum]MBC2661856.1 LysR family transcriptional regulator [Novosphingobium aerophilum]
MHDRKGTAMEWSDLEVYLAAVRTGSYTAAGRQLGVNRTTIGRRVDALERSLGVALFEQTPLGYASTPAGARLLAAAEAIEREVAAMLAEIGAAGRPTASIRVAGTGGIGAEFLPELAAFRQAHPDIPVELLGELDPLDAVTHRRADLGLALVRSPPLHLTGVAIGTLQQAPYARRGTAALPPLGWGYGFEASLPGGAWRAANPAGEAARLAGLTMVNTWLELKQAVRAGIGAASLWCFAADAEPDLVRLSAPDPRHEATLWLVHRAKAPPGPALQTLIAFLGEAIGERIGGTGAAS